MYYISIHLYSKYNINSIPILYVYYILCIGVMLSKNKKLLTTTTKMLTQTQFFVAFLFFFASFYLPVIERERERGKVSVKETDR